jgi:hypothetical protein
MGSQSPCLKVWVDTRSECWVVGHACWFRADVAVTCFIQDTKNEVNVKETQWGSPSWENEMLKNYSTILCFNHELVCCISYPKKISEKKHKFESNKYKFHPVSGSIRTKVSPHKDWCLLVTAEIFVHCFI